MLFISIVGRILFTYNCSIADLRKFDICLRRDQVPGGEQNIELREKIKWQMMKITGARTVDVDVR